jgi:multiple sugar transport system permease protein
MSRSTMSAAVVGRDGVKQRVWSKYLLLCVLAFIFLVPLLFLLVGSLKPNDRVLPESGSWKAFIPTHFSLENYRRVLSRDDLEFTTFFRNSVIVAVVVVAVGLVVNSLLGYALARLPFTGRKVVLAVVIGLTIVPFQAIAIPLMTIFADANLRETYAGLILPFLASPLYTFLFYTFFLNVPKELEEAANVDGAGPMTTFRKIILPLAKPIYATVAILSFLGVWGELLWPVLISTLQSRKTLPQGLSFFYTLPPISWGELMAFAVLMSLPLLVLFLAFQRWFVQSVARSGLKG